VRTADILLRSSDSYVNRQVTGNK